MEKDESHSDEDRRQITIELTADEALVLVELLSRWEETDDLSVPLEHKAEQRVLWNILATLEQSLVEPFMPNYDELVAESRQKVGVPE